MMISPVKSSRTLGEREREREAQGLLFVFFPSFSFCFLQACEMESRHVSLRLPSGRRESEATSCEGLLQSQEEEEKQETEGARCGGDPPGLVGLVQEAWKEEGGDKLLVLCLRVFCFDA